MVKIKSVTIASGKGGVGKTLVSLSIAKKLSDAGKKVAFIDCDIDSSNFAELTGVTDKVHITKDDYIPVVYDNIQVFSMSLLIDKDKAISKSGARYVEILLDVLQSGYWDSEYFIFDLPSGNSDVFRSIIEILSESYVGTVIVGQSSSNVDTRRVINIHKYLDVPILGLIENMSGFTCECGKTYDFFGVGAIEELSNQFGIPYMGSIPLIANIRDKIYDGEPYVDSDVIDTVVSSIITTKPKKLTFFEKSKVKIDDYFVSQVGKIVGALISNANRIIDVPLVISDFDYNDKSVFDIVITNISQTHELTRAHLRLTENGLSVIRNKTLKEKYGGKPRWEIVLSYRTLARVILRKRKVGKKVVDFTPMDAWLEDDIIVYGAPSSARAITLLQEIFESEKITSSIDPHIRKWLEAYI